MRSGTVSWSRDTCNMDLDSLNKHSTLNRYMKFWNRVIVKRKKKPKSRFCRHLAPLCFVKRDLLSSTQRQWAAGVSVRSVVGGYAARQHGIGTTRREGVAMQYTRMWLRLVTILL